MASEPGETRDAPRSEARAWAETIQRAGLSAPASLALQVVQPLGWIGGQMLWIAQPILEGLGISPRRGNSSVARLARFLEREGSMSELIEQIERPGADRGSRSHTQTHADSR